MRTYKTSLTRRHFEIVASALRTARADRQAIERVADELAGSNPRFNRERFITAATWIKPAPPAPSNGRAETLRSFFADPRHDRYVALYANAA